MPVAVPKVTDPIDMSELKRRHVSKPDYDKFNAELSVINEQIEKLKLSLSQVKSSIDNTGNLKDEFSEKRNDLREKLKSISEKQKEIRDFKKNLYDQLAVVNKSIKKKIEDVTQTRQKLTFRSVDEVNKQIQFLEAKMESGTLKLVEEKRIASEMSKLRQSIRVVESLEASQKAIDADKQQADELFKQTRLRDDDLAILKSEYEAIAGELATLSESQDSKFSNLRSLYDQRTTLSKEMDDLFNRRRELREEFQKSKESFAIHIKEEKERRQREFEERREREKLERRQKQAEMEKEMADIPAYTEELNLCHTLITYLNQYLPEDQKRSHLAATNVNQSEFSIRQVDTSLPDGAVALNKKGDREEEYFQGSKKKKGGKQRHRGLLTPTTAIKLPLETMEAFWKLKVTVPVQVGDVLPCVEELEKKTETFKADQERKTRENKEKAEAKIRAILQGLGSQEAEGEVEGEDMNQEEAPEN